MELSIIRSGGGVVTGGDTQLSSVRVLQQDGVNTSGDKPQVTVLACVNASGHYISPMVIFNQSNLSEDLIEGEVPSTLYGLSKCGWMDSGLFPSGFIFTF